LRVGLSLLVVGQLSLIGYWGAYWWMFQARAARSGAGSVGRVLGQPSELEQALMGRVDPDRDRILLSPLAQPALFRQMKNGHITNFARLGIPVVNGQFKFVSCQNVYPDPEMTWGAVMTHGERLDPEILDVAGISLLVTLDNEQPTDASLRRVGRYKSRSEHFQVWENLDVWPRASFIGSPLTANEEAGTILWRRRLLPSRLRDAMSLQVLRPGSYAIQFEAGSSDRTLLISNMVRPDLMTVEGAALVESGPLSDVFAILKVPAGHGVSP
jgi:hypothetical protein